MRFLSRIVALLPFWSLRVFARAFGAIWFHILRVRRTLAAENLYRALGDQLSRDEQQKVLRRCFQHQVLYVLELLRARWMTDSWARKRVRWEGLEHFRAGKGAVIVMAHLGPMDLAGVAFGRIGHGVVVPVKRLGSPRVERFVAEIRSVGGIEALPPRGSGALLAERLREGRLVAMACDQHLGPSQSSIIPFFGRPAATTTAPFRLARKVGVPLYSVQTKRIGFGPELRVSFRPFPFEPSQETDEEAALRMNRLFEDWIRACPEQWLWLHRRWKAESMLERWDGDPLRDSLA